MSREHYPPMTDLEWALTNQGWCKSYHGKGFASPTGYHWKVWRPGRSCYSSGGLMPDWCDNPAEWQMIRGRYDAISRCGRLGYVNNGDGTVRIESL